MRGNLHDGHDPVDGIRSIPARAGEPIRRGTATRQSRVYPRACGGTYRPIPPIPLRSGLSPRVRGNLRNSEHPLSYQRSIPARAGEPETQHTPAPWIAVYPRACGGTAYIGVLGIDRTGLSPRVRGNLQVAHVGLLVRRSIPARAGEPEQGMPSRTTMPVYPRACGGTDERPDNPQQQYGLSPRVRGNLLGWPQSYLFDGSIPARAGEPPYATRPNPPGFRSIPARAGEPRRAHRAGRRVQVYPRACGGTVATPSPTAPRWGLSPRVRGNLWRPLGADAFSGSIPARAGEPVRIARRGPFLRVYPRACGGTAGTAMLYISDPGLSPRVRGNLQNWVQFLANKRSIPARAGEPKTTARPRW